MARRDDQFSQKIDQGSDQFVEYQMSKDGERFSYQISQDLSEFNYRINFIIVAIDASGNETSFSESIRDGFFKN